MGAPKIAETIAAKQIRTVEDFAMLNTTVQKWVEDPSGDYAKAWLRESNPGMLAQLGGKSFYGEIGYYPETKGFDEWAQEIESATVRVFRSMCGCSVIIVRASRPIRM